MFHVGFLRRGHNTYCELFTHQFFLSFFFLNEPIYLGFPGDSIVKNPPAKQEMRVCFLGPEYSLKKEMASSTPLQYSCLGNLMDRGSYQATVYGGRKRVKDDSATKQQLVVQKGSAGKQKLTHMSLQAPCGVLYPSSFQSPPLSPVE